MAAADTAGRKQWHTTQQTPEPLREFVAKHKNEFVIPGAMAGADTAERKQWHKTRQTPAV